MIQENGNDCDVVQRYDNVNFNAEKLHIHMVKWKRFLYEFDMTAMSVCLKTYQDKMLADMSLLNFKIFDQTNYPYTFSAKDLGLSKGRTNVIKDANNTRIFGIDIQKVEDAFDKKTKKENKRGRWKKN